MAPLYLPPLLPRRDGEAAKAQADFFRKRVVELETTIMSHKAPAQEAILQLDDVKEAAAEEAADLKSQLKDLREEMEANERERD